MTVDNSGPMNVGTGIIPKSEGAVCCLVQQKRIDRHRVDAWYLPFHPRVDVWGSDPDNDRLHQHLFRLYRLRVIKFQIRDGLIILPGPNKQVGFGPI